VFALVGVLLLMFGQRMDHIDRVATSPVEPANAPLPVAPAPAARPGPIASVGGHTAAPASATPTATPTPTALTAPVVIFDQTRHRELVVTFRDELRAAGWEVVGTGPWVGTVPATTVYYPPDMEAAANALMAAFPWIARSRPAFDGLPTDALTVILTNDVQVG